MKIKIFTGKKHFLVTVIFFLISTNVYAENIDPYDENAQFAWGENIGWINFEPSSGPGVTVTETELTGFAWGENIGWINLNPTNGGENIGVSNDGAGNLSGYAWGENVGWINFAPPEGGVAIDLTTGEFSGLAWGENIGWINFTIPNVAVKTSWTAAADNCPDDPNKTEPGICGCGIVDDDTDGDGTADCNDNCPADPNKTEVGVCGCGIADIDGDGDGTADCNDNCPADPDKTEPGICGCGIADIDGDGDGYLACLDDCDDTNPNINPGNVSDFCDGLDNDCDNEIDEAGYIFSEFGQPINSDGSSIFKIKKTIPVKITIQDCANVPVSSVILQISIGKISNYIMGNIIEEVNVDDSGNSNSSGTLFRYDETTQQYIYNLSTKKMSEGTYRLTATAENGQSSSVEFSLK